MERLCSIVNRRKFSLENPQPSLSLESISSSCAFLSIFLQLRETEANPPPPGKKKPWDDSHQSLFRFFPGALPPLPPPN